MATATERNQKWLDTHKEFTNRIKFLENNIKDLRIEIVRLEQRNDALQSALVQFTLITRDLQKRDSQFLNAHSIKEGLFLAD